MSCAVMTPKQALSIYRSGCETVVKVICELSAQVEPLKSKVDTLERKVAQLSKTSSNSSKPPSSDVTKPKLDKGKKGKKGKRKIGAQAGLLTRLELEEYLKNKPVDYSPKKL